MNAASRTRFVDSIPTSVLDTKPVYAAITGGVQYAGIPPERNIAPTDPRLTAIADSVLWNVVIRKVAYQVIGGCPATRPVIAEDIAFVSALNRHFAVFRATYPSVRYHIRRDNTAGRFLGLTRRDGDRFAFVESPPEEKGLEDKLGAFIGQSDSNVESLRAMLRRGKNAT